ncbi:MAG: sugar phosphate nucleotidyltransferase [Treponema sp.]|nr:sugar phosphate nucleotidyltransferase [Treponema sp.]
MVLPSDHVIADVPTFQKAVIQAAENAEKGFLVTFGIVLSCPVNGCGYRKDTGC